MPLTAATEQERLAALHDLEILDVPAESHFDAICRTASGMFATSASAVSLIDAERQVFKARCGLPVREIPRRGSFCNAAIAGDEVFVVEDATADTGFADHTAVTGPTAIRFYAGAPLVIAPGVRVGTLCILDTAPRTFGDEDRARLRDLATIVVAQLRLHKEIVDRRRREAQDLLRQRELSKTNRLLRLAEQVGEIGHWRVRLASQERSWSDAIYRIVGFAPGTPPPDFDRLIALYHADDRRRVSDILTQAATHGRDFSYEAKLQRPCGEVRDVLVRGICERDSSGSVASLFGVMIDLTDQRRMHAGLVESDARYQALADTLPQIVWLWRTSDGRTTYVNGQFERFYGPIGRDREARLARNHPDDAPRMESVFREATRTGRAYEVEGRLRGGDGEYRWHKLMMIPIQRGGVVTEWLGTALDIDEIVVARGALEETSDLLRLAQEAAGAGSWSWDLRTGVVLLSSGSARLHNREAEQDLALSTEEWTALMNPVDRGPLWENMHVAIARNEAPAAEYRVGDAAAARWVRLQGRVIRDEAGRPQRIVGLHFDISAQKAVAEALVDAKAKAETAQHAAEEASAAKSQFLATMSHEIRTPLNGILGYADLLAQDSLTPSQCLHVERVRAAGAALLTVVNDVLDFSKIEAGQVEIDARPFALRPVVDTAVALVQQEAERKGLVLTARVDPAVPAHLVGDEGRVRQVILNLLGNAVKFTASGRVEIAVAARNGDGPAGLRIAVTDTGIGIPRDKRGRLFERFSQVDGSIQRKFGGTGLGLAICKQLVEAMGGTIGVESREGAGSTFWFTLALPEGVSPNAIAAAPVVGANAGAARLLLVEDVAINRDLARTILCAGGYAVETAADGVEAVAAVVAGSFDLVLMDVQMPVMDGLTATRRIRDLADPVRRNLPIVAMTANVLPDQVAQCLAAGMNDCIGKPFRREELHAVIARNLPSPSAHPAEGASHAPDLLDEAAFGAIRNVIGAERTAELLCDLAAELRAAFGDAAIPPEPERLSFSAHAMASASGMLGFAYMSSICREVEAACVTGDELGPLVRKLAKAQAATLERIATLVAA